MGGEKNMVLSAVRVWERARGMPLIEGLRVKVLHGRGRPF